MKPLRLMLTFKTIKSYHVYKIIPNSSVFMCTINDSIERLTWGY